MPENLRRVILLREWQGLSYAEIAETTGHTHAAVETLIFRARRHLAKALAAVNIGTPFWLARRWLWASAAPAKVAAGTPWSSGSPAAGSCSVLRSIRRVRTRSLAVRRRLLSP